MAIAAALGKLPESLNKLIWGALEEGPMSVEFGKSTEDRTEVAVWLEKVAQGDIAKAEKVNVSVYET